MCLLCADGVKLLIMTNICRSTESLRRALGFEFPMTPFACVNICPRVVAGLLPCSLTRAHSDTHLHRKSREDGRSRRKRKDKSACVKESEFVHFSWMKLGKRKKEEHRIQCCMLPSSWKHFRLKWFQFELPRLSQTGTDKRGFLYGSSFSPDAPVLRALSQCRRKEDYKLPEKLHIDLFRTGESFPREGELGEVADWRVEQRTLYRQNRKI